VRVLVTGATGFTGGHLVQRLKALGYEVRAMVRSADRARALQQSGVSTVIADVARPETLPAAVAGVEVVYHVAALYRQAGLPPSAYRTVNAEGPGRLVEAAATAGARRVVHCSTVGVHGDVEHPPAEEDAPLRPGDIYQETKLEGEYRASEAAARAGIELVIARPSGIYGPGDRRLLKLFRGVARRRFIVLGSGRVFYHLTYVTDVAEGLRLCGDVPRAAGRTYILAGPGVTTLNELLAITAEEAGTTPPRIYLPAWPFWVAGAAAEIVCRPFGIEPPIYRRRVDFFTKSRAFRFERARGELGYEPAVSLREGIRKTLAWYREHGWL
jgi:nucleoside-diphosphate-sugar epimerase